MRRVIQPIEGRRSRVALKGFRTENHPCQFLVAAFEYSRVSRLTSVRGRLIPLRSRWCLSTCVAQGYVRRLNRDLRMEADSTHQGFSIGVLTIFPHSVQEPS